MRPAVLAARDVVKAFRSGGTEAVVLDHINLAVAEGNFVTIVGPSGCGKTTLLQLLAGLEPVTSGLVEYCRRPVQGASTGGGVPLPAVQQVDLPVVDGARERGLRTRVAARAPTGSAGSRSGRSMLGLVGLSGMEGHYPSQLSRGTQQRLAIARALATQTAKIMACEPATTMRAVLTSRIAGNDTLRPRVDISAAAAPDLSPGPFCAAVLFGVVGHREPAERTGLWTRLARDLRRAPRRGRADGSWCPADDPSGPDAPRAGRRPDLRVVDRRRAGRTRSDAVRHHLAGPQRAQVPACARSRSPTPGTRAGQGVPDTLALTFLLAAPAVR